MNNHHQEVVPCFSSSMSSDMFLDNDFPHVASPEKSTDGDNIISWIEPMEDLLPPPPLTLFSSMENNNRNNKLVDPTPIGPRGSLRVVDQVPLSKAFEDLARGCILEGGADGSGMEDCLRPFLAPSSNLVMDEFTPSTPLPAAFQGQVVQPSCFFQGFGGSSQGMTLPFGIQGNVANNAGGNSMSTIMSPAPTTKFTPKASRVTTKGKVAPRRVSYDEHYSIPQAVSPSSSSASSSPSSASASSCKLRSFQSKLWKEKFEELLEYREKYGTCHVPHDWKGNPALAKWVKRQRYQYKLKRDGKHTTLTDDREDALNDVGFVWQSHRSAWEERYDELCAFRMVHGHCSVPATANTGSTPTETMSSGETLQSNTSAAGASPQLSVWVQCQRRQYRLYLRGERSFMTEERIQKLNNIGFVWKPRGSSTPSSSTQSLPSPTLSGWAQNHQVLLQL